MISCSRLARRPDVIPAKTYVLNVFAVLIVAASFGSGSALANNLSENFAWQFESMADKANKAFIEDMRQKKNSGYYSAPIYNTTIDRQYNCSVSSLATGNQSTSSAVGNAQTTSGAATSATGNSDTTEVTQGYSATSPTVNGTQWNGGAVTASTHGDVSARAHIHSFQALNTEQTNSGNQHASIRDSNACNFAAMN